MMSVQWPDPDLHVSIVGVGFVRLTGIDGPPGVPGVSNFEVWGAGIEAGLPDLAGLTKTGPDGVAVTPVAGDWVLTNDNGDLKLWKVTGATTVDPTAIDLTDGPQGPPGRAASGQHTHNLAMAAGVPSFGSVRDRFAGLQFPVGVTLDYRP